MEGKFVMYTRHFMRNPLLARKQMVIEVIHPELPNVPKRDLKEKLGKMYKAKEENIAVYGLKTKFGGGRSTGFALIYDSLDERKKFDSKIYLKRDGMLEKPARTRKQKKEIKGRVKKVRGTKKAAAAAAGGDKKKKKR